MAIKAVLNKTVNELNQLQNENSIRKYTIAKIQLMDSIVKKAALINTYTGISIELILFQFYFFLFKLRFD